MANSATRKRLTRELDRSIGNLYWCRVHLSRCLEVFINQSLSESNISVDELLNTEETNISELSDNEDVQDMDKPDKEVLDRTEELIQIAKELEVPERYQVYVTSIVATIEAIDLIVTNIARTNAVL